MEFIREEGKVFGARYYTLQPVFPADGNTWFRAEWDQMVSWCVDVYGPSPSIFDGEATCGRWYVNNAKFWFRNDEDVTFFLLKWI